MKAIFHSVMSAVIFQDVVGDFSSEWLKRLPINDATLYNRGSSVPAAFAANRF